MYIRQFRSDHTAVVYTLTVGLIVPALALAWLTSVLTMHTAVEERQAALPVAPLNVRAPLPSEVQSAHG
jgi:hypothetical protein